MQKRSGEFNRTHVALSPALCNEVSRNKMKFITTTHSTKVHFEMPHENSAEMDETRLKLGNASDQATIDISSA